MKPQICQTITTQSLVMEKNLAADYISTNPQQSSVSKWQSLLAFILVFLVGNIPIRAIGGRLRNILYRAIFHRIGSSVYIQNDVEFKGVSAIEIGNGVEILRGTRIYAHGHPNNRIYLGDGVRLQQGVDIRGLIDTYLQIDEGTYIGQYVCIAGYGDIKIGKDCLIASHCTLIASNHNYADPTRKIIDQGVTSKGIVIEDDCWLGNGVTVVDGVTIGKGSVIGAGAVVTKDIPPYSVAVGVPARVIKSRNGKELMTHRK